MLKRKCIVLSDVENDSNKKAVLALEEDGVGVGGTLRLYNFSAEPLGVLSLGLYQKSKVFKAGLTRKSQMFYTFFLDLKQIPSVFSCAIVNFQNAQPKPILFGSSSGNNDEVYANIISELSDKKESAATAQKVLDKYGVDYADDEKAQIEAEIDTAICTNCENCIYKKHFLQQQEKENLSKNQQNEKEQKENLQNESLQNENQQKENLQNENFQTDENTPKIFRVENFLGEEKKCNILKNNKNSVKFSNFFEKNSDFSQNLQNFENFNNSNAAQDEQNLEDFNKVENLQNAENFQNTEKLDKFQNEENYQVSQAAVEAAGDNGGAFDFQTDDNEQVDFFGRLKPQIDKLFQENPAEEHLQEIIPSSKWVRVESGDDDFYVFGLLYDEDGQIRYVCYGVPAVFEENPPKELLGYPIWLPLGQDDGFGYWLMYQDAATGQPVKAVIS